jgi:hypothetical protein
VVRVPGNRSRGPSFDSRRYQIFWEVVGLERGPLSLVSTTEERLRSRNPKYGRRDPSLWPRDIPSTQKLALSSPTSGGRWVGIVHSRTKATELALDWSPVVMLSMLHSPSENKGRVKLAAQSQSTATVECMLWDGSSSLRISAPLIL